MHRLDPLLRPRSLAFVGASARPGSVGQVMMQHLKRGGYAGRLYPVNPRYESVEGVPCYDSLRALPEIPEHVIFAVRNEQVEAEFDTAFKLGVPAATILSSLILAEDTQPPLMERIRRKGREAGMLLCGGNSMGFYNLPEGIWACGFVTRDSHRPGRTTLITQSGSVVNSLVDAEERIDFNLIVSTGQELGLTAADYLDFALEMPSTSVVGLFIETVRDPSGFVAGLAKANAKGIPVVALKVGRTEESARLAATHSGAIAGNDAVYQALFEHYGVARVASLDEMATTLIMFAQPAPVGPGGLATIHDSGGERALLVDLAADVGVSFARLGTGTLDQLGTFLDPGLPPGNPLDAWGSGRDAAKVFTDCFALMMRDPATALGATVCDRGPAGVIFPHYIDYLRTAGRASGKPVFLVANHQGSGGDPLAVSTTREGFPVLDGIQPFLRGVKHLFDYRDFRVRPAMTPPHVDHDAVAEWRARLATGQPLGEPEALALLGAFGLPVIPHEVADSGEAAAAAAARIGYPVAMKTAEPGVTHKSDVGGVRLGLVDAGAVEAAYRGLAARIGPRVLVAAMAAPGVELILGVINDPQFGPVVMLGGGGIHAEILQDALFALPPFDAVAARSLVARLKLSPLLEGARGQPPADTAAFCEAAAKLSVLAAEFGPALGEVDINPIVVYPHGCAALDALIVPSAGVAACHAEEGGITDDARADPVL